MTLTLAPLAEFTNAAFRRLCARRGAALTCTEMVSAAALAHEGDADRGEAEKTRELLVTLPGEGHVACQLFGGEPEQFAAAARAVTALGRFAAIDVNAGCPVPRIRRSGAGAELVTDPERVRKCLAAVRSETDLPVTLKTRPGPRPDRVTMFELLAAAEDAGASGMTLHARFTSQMHGGEVHLDLLADLVARARIPITGNGGVRTRADAEKMAQTGVAAVMVGRAAVDDPGVFAQFAESGPAARRATFEEHVAGLLELRERLAREFPAARVPPADGFVAAACRRHLFRYFKGLPGAARMRRAFVSVRTLAEARAAVADLFSEDFPAA